MELSFTPKIILDSLAINQELTMTKGEILKLDAVSELVEKYIKLKAVSIQIEVGNGDHKGEEGAYLTVSNTLFTIAEGLSTIKDELEKAEIREKTRQEELEKKELPK